jgi:hypothetical protein
MSSSSCRFEGRALRFGQPYCGYRQLDDGWPGFGGQEYRPAVTTTRYRHTHDGSISVVG